MRPRHSGSECDRRILLENSDSSPKLSRGHVHQIPVENAHVAVVLCGEDGPPSGILRHDVTFGKFCDRVNSEWLMIWA